MGERSVRDVLLFVPNLIGYARVALFAASVFLWHRPQVARLEPLALC
jgi:hypothetical protein